MPVPQAGHCPTVHVVLPLSFGSHPGPNCGSWLSLAQIISPTDVWLWVQGVDALCLQYLLGDGVIEEQTVVDAYKEQFAFGASQRVKVRSAAP